MINALLLALLASTVPSAPIAGPAVAVHPTTLVQDIPQADGWVTDLAGFLSDQEERSLEALMESYKQGSNQDIVLLTVPSLEGGSLEKFSLEVAREWGLGSQDRNDGALLLVSRDDRKMRIEVGRGLEGELTDATCGRIIRDIIAPEFKQGQFPKGLRAGIETMHAVAGGDYARLNQSSRRRGSRGNGLGGVIAIIVLLMVFGRRGGRGGMGGMLPWILLSMNNRGGGFGGGGFRSGGGGGGGFSGFGGGGGFSGGGASGGW